MRKSVSIAMLLPLLGACGTMGGGPSSIPGPSRTLPEGFEVAAPPAPAAQSQMIPAPAPTVSSGAVITPSVTARANPAGAPTVNRTRPRPGSAEAGDGLGPLDMISVEVFGIPDLSRNVEVNGAGEIQLPLIGPVLVEGLTPDEAARAIENRYRGRYVVNPSVSIRVTQRQARLLSVTGAVARPGVYPFSGPTTLVQGLALGGGFDVNGAASVVQLLRTENGQDRLLAYDVKAIEAGLIADPWLVPGDRIIVQSSPRVVTVAGFVKQPGVYPFQGSLTLTQALSLGGGQLDNANLRSVNIIRTVEGQDQISGHDLGAIIGGLAADPVVVPGDRVIVSAVNQAVTVDGAVTEPTSIDWQQGLTLSRAIAQAKGLSPQAAAGRVAVLRMIDGQLKVAQFDMRTINAGTSPDPALLPDDRVVVGESQIARLIRDYAPLANVFYLLSIGLNNN